MSSSSDQSDASSSRSGDVPEASAEVSGESILQNVLHDVLSFTEGDLEKSPGGQQIRQELIAVARKHGGVGFQLDPVVYSLVEVITSRIQPLSREQRETMTQSVARTLYDDVSSRMRIERLWERLRRQASDGQ